MKRLIAVLLVMGVIMTAFAETATETATGTAGRVYIIDTATPAAETDVVLSLNQNAGIVWFSSGANQNVNTYVLSLPEISGLNQSTSGNDNWFAKGTDLKLNWNIVSVVPVSISLEITAPMTRTVEEGSTLSDDDKIGWKVTSGGQTISFGENDTQPASKVVYKKNTVKYGEAGSQSIVVETNNVWGKNSGKYTATLTAYIKTTG